MEVMAMNEYFLCPLELKLFYQIQISVISRTSTIDTVGILEVPLTGQKNNSFEIIRPTVIYLRRFGD